MKPTIEAVKQSTEFTDYCAASLRYWQAWQSGKPAEIEHRTNHLLASFDRLSRVCQHYCHLTDECRRTALDRARYALGVTV